MHLGTNFSLLELQPIGIILESLWNDYPWTLWIWAKKMPKNFSKSKLQTGLMSRRRPYSDLDLISLCWIGVQKILHKILTISLSKRTPVKRGHATSISYNLILLNCHFKDILECHYRKSQGQRIQKRIFIKQWTANNQMPL